MIVFRFKNQASSFNSLGNLEINIAAISILLVFPQSIVDIQPVVTFFHNGRLGLDSTRNMATNASARFRISSHNPKLSVR